MDITKLTGTAWNSSGLFGEGDDDSAVNTFLNDTNEMVLTSKVSDLLSGTRMRHQRQFTEKREMAKSLSAAALPQSSGGLEPLGASKKAKKTATSRGHKVSETSNSVIERPANRVDIAALERELEVRVKAIVDLDSVSIEDPRELADPRKDGMIIIRDKLLKEFGADIDRLKREPWLDVLIKCECIKISCDDVGKKLIDMLSVSSVELGNVLRKLRLAYMQSFEQMRVSWQVLRATFIEYENELLNDREKLNRLAYEVENKEGALREQMGFEISTITEQFQAEKAELQDALNASEFKQEQMGETLLSLNGIFKNMQADGSTVRLADLKTKCDRLEKDNKEIGDKILSLDKTKNDLQVALEKIEALEKENRAKDIEISSLKQQMIRREETVVALMERESIRNAEIEKMKDITGIQGDDEDYGINMKEPATSVLCIKCKKGLDDLSNIRAAILNKSDKATIQCEGYRVLLPNLRGRRPNRSNEWLRTCMRNILISKMREDVSLLDVKGTSSKFSAYVYAWFVRPTDYSNGGNEIKTLQQADEDRWGLYYGVKAMAKDNDPEAVIFWTLLEERYGQDGMQFIFHCLSISLSMGGPDLWKQFGSSLTSAASSIDPSQHDKPSLRHHIWLDIGTAIESVKCILVRALKPHVQEVVDAIYAFRVLPGVADPQIVVENKRKKEGGGNGEEKGEGEEGSFDPASAVAEDDLDNYDDQGNLIVKDEPGLKGEKAQAEPTHLCIFVWLRLMLQQIQAEQIHRAAAVRLMCESASIGALTPQLQSINDKDDLGSQGAQVEYPQFSMIAKTLFPGISTLDTATLFHACYDEGRRKVTSDVLMKIADKMGLFAKAMKLSVLPLLSHEIKEGKTFEELVKGLPRPSDESMAPEEEEGLGFENDDQSVSSGIPKAAAEEEVETATKTAAKLELPSDLPPSTEQRLRVRLANLIHRKAAAILPDFNLLVQRVPDRWKALLNEARDNVKDALVYASDKIKRDKLTANDIKAPSNHFVDGIQPYVQYRRLLATMLLVKSLCDNPLLPSELFLGENRQVMPSFEYSFKHVENLLTSLEAGIVTGLRLDKMDSPAQPTTKVLIQTVRITEALAKRHFGSLGASKVYRYEACRRNLVARKIQNWYRAYFQGLSSQGGFHKHYYDAVVPPSVRQHMRPGYLRGMRQLRSRKIDLPPWWAEAQLAEVMAFKINYDNIAIRVGKPMLPLGQAVVAYSLHFWSSIEVAERHVQDLMYCIQVHHAHNARLGLFADFLGIYTREIPRNETELEEMNARENMGRDEPAKLLQMDVASSLYVNLLADIHRELANASVSKAAPRAVSPTSFLADVGITVAEKKGVLASEDPAGASNPLLLRPETAGVEEGKAAPLAEEAVAQASVAVLAPAAAQNTSVGADAPTSAPKQLNSVITLYPVMDTPQGRVDESGPWLLNASICANAARRWAQNLRGLSDEALCAFPDFAEVLKLNSKELTQRINVDEFMWLCMKQWAQYTSYSLYRCAARAVFAIKQAPTAPVPNTAAGDPDADMVTSMYVEAAAPKEKDNTMSLPKQGAFTTLYLNSIIESIYKSNENQIHREANPHFAPVAFLRTLGEGTLQAQSLAAILKLLRAVTIWDSHAFNIHAPPREKADVTDADTAVDAMITLSASPAAAITWNQASDTEPATSFSLGYVHSGTSGQLLTDCVKNSVTSYLPSLTALLEERGEQNKRRQKNKSKNISEPDNLLWNFPEVKKTLDSTKLALRSLQHMRDDNLWAEKGTGVLVNKVRACLSGVQDLISLTEIVRFSSDAKIGSRSVTMTGPFPTDLEEIAKRIHVPKPAKEVLPIFNMALSKIS